MDDKRIPKLRFPEFSDEWEQRKLKEVAVFSKGSGYSKGDLTDTGTPIILYGRLYTKYETTIREVDTFVSPKSSSVYSKGGEVIVPASGETAEDIARAAVVENAGVLLGGDLNIISPNDNINSAFLALSISNGTSQKELAKKAQGKSVVHIHNEEIKSLDISFPSKLEQDKITAYFSEFDSLITLHQRKCDSLKELRDGIIQRIFSRELRFKRLDGREFENWVTKELSEIFTERKVSQTITEDAPLLSFTIEQGVINPQDKKTNKRDFLIKDKDTKKFALTEVDDIIYNPANLKYGAIHRNKLMRGVVSPIYAIFYTEQNPAFMEYVVKNPTFIKNSMRYLEGTVIKLMTLKPRDFLKLKVEIPASLEEQKIIADFLMKFDETIDAEQKIIEKWKELKKGLLQQMFV